MATVLLENVSVDFPIYGTQRSLRKALFERATGGVIKREGKHQDRITVKALNDISLKLQDGDRVGLIGLNGSGKSTLLRLVAGLYEPVKGAVSVQGRITPLFDTMPGLDGEDTGYENIITAGLLIGMSRDQIEEKIPEIEEFCELGEYLSLPVRTYSTGMAMRLGFALATALDPDILLMDEGFGSGDQRFAERARERMNSFIGRSRIMLLASHSNVTINSMCNKALWLSSGQIEAFGPVDEVCSQYYATVHAAARKTEEERKAAASQAQRASPDPYTGDIREVGLTDRAQRTTGAVRFTYAMAHDEAGRPKWNYRPGDTLRFHFEFEVFQRVSNLAFLFRLILPDTGISGQQIVTDIKDSLSDGPLDSGQVGSLDLALPDTNLMPNRFLLYVVLFRVGGRPAFDVIDGNVFLPPLLIENHTADADMHGAVSLNYNLRKTFSPNLAACTATER